MALAGGCSVPHRGSSASTPLPGRETAMPKQCLPTPCHLQGRRYPHAAQWLMARSVCHAQLPCHHHGSALSIIFITAAHPQTPPPPPRIGPEHCPACAHHPGSALSIILPHPHHPTWVLSIVPCVLITPTHPELCPCTWPVPWAVPGRSARQPGWLGSVARGIAGR